MGGRRIEKQKRRYAGRSAEAVRQNGRKAEERQKG